MVQESIDPVLDERFAMVVLRRPGDHDMAARLIETVREKKDTLYREWQSKIARAISLSYNRELGWIKGGKITPEQLVSYTNPVFIGLWVLAKASTGRAELAWRPGLPDAAEEMSHFIPRGLETVG